MSLNEPDAFLDDWYGWLTNQISHIALGVFMAFIVCAAYYVAAGEFPVKSLVWLFVLMFYAGIEFFKQRFVGFDTIEDIVFVIGYGASAVLAGFAEIDPGNPYVALNVVSLLPFFAVSICHMVAGVAYRISLEGKHGRSGNIRD